MNDPRISSEIQNVIEKTERLLNLIRKDPDLTKVDIYEYMGRVSDLFIYTIDTIENLFGQNSEIYKDVSEIYDDLSGKINRITEKALGESKSSFWSALKHKFTGMPQWAYQQALKAYSDHLILLIDRLEKQCEEDEKKLTELSSEEEIEKRIIKSLEEDDEALTMIEKFRERGDLDIDRITRLLNEAGFDAAIRDVRGLLEMLEGLGAVEKINLDRYRLSEIGKKVIFKK